MIRKIKSYISRSKTIAILCHIHSDGDALCSSFALADILSAKGKEVVCILEEEPGEKYDFLNGKYVVFSDSLVKEFDMCIAVDCGDISRLGKRVEIFNKAKVTLNIDHHKTNNDFAMFNVVKPEYCAAAEVLAEFFEKIRFKLSDNAARLLYAGIMSDSGSLKYSNVRAETHVWVSKLLRYDFDHAEVNRLLFDSQTMGLVRLTGHIMNNVECFENGLISFISSDDSMLEEYGVEESEANALINIPRKIKGAQIAIELKMRSGLVRASLRSNGRCDVNRVAALFGGGGHEKAAGVTFNGKTMDEAKELLIKAATDELKRCGL